MITKRTELHFYRNVGFQQVLKKQVWSITVNTRSNPGIYRKCWAAQNTNMKLIFFFRARSQFSRGSHLLFYLCQIRSHVRILIIIGYYTLLYSYNFNPIKNNMVVIIFRNYRQNEIVKMKYNRINIKWCLVSTSFKIYLDILSYLYITFTIFYYNTISLKCTFFSCSS